MGDLLGIMILAGSIYLFPESASQLIYLFKISSSSSWDPFGESLDEQVRKLEGVVTFLCFKC